jgi:integration host factor subunit alpha
MDGWAGSLTESFGENMALTKADLVESLAGKGFGKKEATDLVESMLEIIKDTLQKKDDVLISGFGKFCVKEKGKRRGRNPQTGQDLLLRERRVVTFKCSSVLRNHMNSHE